MGATSQTVPPPEPPSQPSDTERLLAAQYDTQDGVNALAQRIFSLEASVHQLQGDIEDLRKLLILVQPDQLATVAEALRGGIKARAKRALREWLS